MGGRKTFDPEKFQLDIAKLKKNGNLFEVVVDADAAILFRERKPIEVRDVLKYEKIFADAQRGQQAPEGLFEPAFGTKDILAIAKVILEKGEIQITAEYKKKIVERKRKQVLTLLHKNAIDARTGIPHTIDRLEMALHEAKVKIDEFRTPEEQLQDIARRLQPILPLKFEVKIYQVHIQQKYAEAGYAHIKAIAKVIQSSWDPMKNWTGQIELPGGMEEEFFNRINGLTHGTAQIEILKKH